MLYALRYQRSQPQNIAALITLLLQNGVKAEDARVIMNLSWSTVTYGCPARLRSSEYVRS
jgi:hypothetical protein